MKFKVQKSPLIR